MGETLGLFVYSSSWSFDHIYRELGVWENVSDVIFSALISGLMILPCKSLDKSGILIEAVVTSGFIEVSSSWRHRSIPVRKNRACCRRHCSCKPPPPSPQTHSLSCRRSLLTMRTQMISSLLRARPATLALRASVAPAFARPSSSAHGQETFESFSERYVSFFQSAQDLFEVQRGLNNCFAHDLVPSPAVIESALRAARRVNDYSTAVRILEGVKEKVENKQQYESYLEELKPVREELGESNLPLGIWG